MKHPVIRIGTVVVALCFFCGNAVQAQSLENGNDKTLSPYFLVISDDEGVDQLPLKSTSAHVSICGVIADVRVTQVYENRGKVPLEAIYVFPASTRAAVYGMKMTIGERTIVADIRTREDARQQYEQAKAQGRSASLLEQKRPNVFQMNVANILPEDVIKVELSYTELLLPVDAEYEFVYPTVAGPRYVSGDGADAGSGDEWVANPYLKEGEKPGYTFDIRVDLSGGMPIRDIVCASHKTAINYEGRSFASVTLDRSELYGGNRDFICRYRLSGTSIDSGLLLYEGEDENFFLAMVQPPQRVRPAQIPPREYIFIVDVSGSMRGFPLDVSKALLKDLIGSLRDTDTFNVLLFAGGSSVLSEQSLPATEPNIAHALSVIERQRGGGGTELLPALKKALTLPCADGHSRTIIIVTDGYVSVEKEAFDLIRNSLGRANMFAFGIGSSVNRYLIDGMARAGMGDPFIVTKAEDAAGMASRFRKLLASPVLTDITLSFKGFDTYDMEPLSIPDVFAGRPVVVFGKWRGNPQGTVRVQGTAGDETFVKELDVSGARIEHDSAVLKYLWARHKIAVLSDYTRLGYDEERISEVRSLGLMYHLLTEYTSFVAVDSQVRLDEESSVTVRQPLPLPQGVSNYAVSGGMRTAKMSARTLPQSMAVSDEVKSLEERSAVERETGGVIDDTAGKIRLEIKEITVTGQINRDAVKRLIEGNVTLMELCPADIESGTELVFTLVVDASGRVKDVSMDKGILSGWQARKCIMKKLEQVWFPSSKGSQDSRIRLVFNVKPINS